MDSQFWNILEAQKPQFVEKLYMKIQYAEHIHQKVIQVKEAIKATKVKKSPDPVGICPKLIKCGTDKLTEML